MAFSDDLLNLLRQLHLCDGSTGWTGAVDWMPPEVLADSIGVAIPQGDPRRDQVVLVTGYGGAPPDEGTGPGRPGWDEPSCQVRVRGTAEDLRGARRKIDEIDQALRPTAAPVFGDGMVIERTTYLWIKARQANAMFLGMDEQNYRPEYTRNYDVGRSR